MILYAIRHKATGKFMPQLRGRGYTYWNPASINPMNDLTKKDLKVLRLFPSFDNARRAIVQWNAIPNAKIKFSVSFDGTEDNGLDIKEDGRTKEDLEIVEVRVKIKGPDEPYWSEL